MNRIKSSWIEKQIKLINYFRSKGAIVDRREGLLVIIYPEKAVAVVINGVNPKYIYVNGVYKTSKPSMIQALNWVYKNIFLD